MAINRTPPTGKGEAGPIQGQGDPGQVPVQAENAPVGGVPERRRSGSSLPSGQISVVTPSLHLPSSQGSYVSSGSASVANASTDSAKQRALHQRTIRENFEKAFPTKHLDAGMRAVSGIYAIKKVESESLVGVKTGDPFHAPDVERAASEKVDRLSEIEMAKSTSEIRQRIFGAESKGFQEHARPSAAQIEKDRLTALRDFKASIRKEIGDAKKHITRFGNEARSREGDREYLEALPQRLGHYMDNYARLARHYVTLEGVEQKEVEFMKKVFDDYAKKTVSIATRAKVCLLALAEDNDVGNLSNLFDDLRDPKVSAIKERGTGAIPKGSSRLFVPPKQDDLFTPVPSPYIPPPPSDKGFSSGSKERQKSKQEFKKVDKSPPKKLSEQEIKDLAAKDSAQFRRDLKHLTPGYVPPSKPGSKSSKDSRKVSPRQRPDYFEQFKSSSNSRPRPDFGRSGQGFRFGAGTGSGAAGFAFESRSDPGPPENPGPQADAREQRSQTNFGGQPRSTRFADPFPTGGSGPHVGQGAGAGGFGSEYRNPLDAAPPPHPLNSTSIGGEQAQYNRFEARYEDRSGSEMRPPRMSNLFNPNQFQYEPPGTVGFSSNYEQRPLVKLKEHYFDATPKTDDWMTFKAGFKAVVGDRQMPDSQKLFMLIDMLEGEPKRIAKRLAGSEYDTQSYRMVWGALEENYGGIHRARKRAFALLESFPKINKFNSENTLELSSLISNILRQYSGDQGLMDEGGVLNSMAKKLIPEYELQTYFLECAKARRSDTLQQFYEFLDAKRVACKLASIHLSSLKSEAKTYFSQDFDCDSVEEGQLICKTETTNGQNSSSARIEPSNLGGQRNSPKEDSKPGFKCPVCQADHRLWQCDDFKLKSLKDKYAHVRENKLCYHCIGAGHQAKDCSFYPDRKCGLQGCDKYHHRVLHNFQEGGKAHVTIEMYLAMESADVAGSDPPTVCNHVQTMFAEREDYCAIRTTTVLLTCNGKKRRVVVAMDPCSNSTNIDADFAKEMNLVVEKTGIEREINFLERKATISSEQVSFMLSPLNSDVVYPVKAFTIKNLVSGTPVINWSQVAKEYPHLQAADIPQPDPRDKVMILLGTDYAHLNGTMHGLIGRDFEPIAEYTKLGWAFSGRVKNCQILNGNTSQFGIASSKFVSFCTYVNRVDVTSLRFNTDQLPKTQESLSTLTPEQVESCLLPLELAKKVAESSEFFEPRFSNLSSSKSKCESSSPEPGLSSYLSCDSNTQESLHELDVLMRKQWELDAIGLVERVPRFSSNLKEKPPTHWTKAEKEAYEQMAVVYLPDLKQFQVSIPWKDGRPAFRSNRLSVKARQERACANLGKNFDKVKEIFDGYLSKDYIRKLEPHEVYEQDCHYLPFFCVVRDDSPTTPVRIVWDCAAKYNEKSLNSEINQTPNLLQDLFKVLMRLRKFRYVVTSDISEMFLKVRLDPKDRRYHRFFFNGEYYEWNVMLFGNRSSPDGSQKVIQMNCLLHGKGLDEATETVTQSCYMDDTADSKETEEKALALALQLIELFSFCGMPVHKFFSNSDLVCKTLEKKTLAKQISFSDTSDVVYDTGKVLGMIYSIENGDVLTFSSKFRNMRELSSVENGQWTKRELAKLSASIFDPLGLVSPFVVRSKVILQEVWRQKIGWDEVLPPSICQAWEVWIDQVFDIPDIRIKRWSGLKSKAQAYQIHTFCDASEEGYCVTVYIRTKSGSQVETNLMAAKARVSPLKAESISRQELVACVLAVRMCSAVKETYPATVENTFFWTDSEVCLAWINFTAKSFKAFVAHRVGEIQTYTEPRQWLHVPTSQNPADIGTRNISAKELKESNLWWEGPEFLKKDISEWPKSKVVRLIESIELKQSVFLSFFTLNKADFVDRFLSYHPSHFSVGKSFDGLRKCIRKWAFVLKAVNLFKGRRSLQKFGPVICPEDTECAKRFLTKQSQLEFFQTEIELMAKKYEPLARSGQKSTILLFDPFLDEHGIVRSNSRLSQSNQPYESSHPIILHRRSDFARLIAEKAHFGLEHPISFAAMKAEIRRFYAILGLGILCEQIRNRCSICSKMKAKAIHQKMAPLPERRLGDKLKAFQHVGLDFAGPFELKMGRAKARKKVWVLVLTCMVVRAVHFEPTGGMDSTHVVNALSRFCDMRGVPDTITSDNQTSFHKANKELCEWYDSIDWEFVGNQTGFNVKPSSKGITWHFNPPNAPHFGGIFETMVKAMKRALQATIGRADLDEEEFRTVISKVAHLLNCRPIQAVPDVDDFETLTPNHFLLPALAEAVFPPDVKDISQVKLSTRLRHQVMVQEHVWKRFHAEIVPLLGPRKRWSAEVENLKEDDVVLELDENLPRGLWRMLRVAKVLPSADGLVRKVEVANEHGKIYSRPISRLIPVVRE